MSEPLRHFILCMLHARISNGNPVSPKHPDFIDLAEEFILEHYGVDKDQLLSRTDFRKDLSRFKHNAKTYMGKNSFKKFIKDANCQVHTFYILGD